MKMSLKWMGVSFEMSGRTKVREWCGFANVYVTEVWCDVWLTLGGVQCLKVHLLLLVYVLCLLLLFFGVGIEFCSRRLIFVLLRIFKGFFIFSI